MRDYPPLANARVKWMNTGKRFCAGPPGCLAVLIVHREGIPREYREVIYLYDDVLRKNFLPGLRVVYYRDLIRAAVRKIENKYDLSRSDFWQQVRKTLREVADERTSGVA
jgi:hypothetical protein